MSTRSLAARLKKIEFRWAPTPEPPKIIISIVNSKGKILYEMRFGKGGNEYFSVDGQPNLFKVGEKCQFFTQFILRSGLQNEPPVVANFELSDSAIVFFKNDGVSCSRTGIGSKTSHLRESVVPGEYRRTISNFSKFTQ